MSYGKKYSSTGNFRKFSSAELTLKWNISLLVFYNFIESYIRDNIKSSRKLVYKLC